MTDNIVEIYKGIALPYTHMDMALALATRLPTVYDEILSYTLTGRPGQVMHEHSQV